MASSVGSEATTIGDNVGLVAAMIAVVVAQVLKPFSDWTVTGRFKAGLMVGSGGFPSSHSSLVTALATGAAYQSGLGDPAFATALVLALVVMYDAMGVRRQAGYHATAINNLVTAFPSEAAFGRHAAETDSYSLEAGLVTGGYQSGGGGDETNASNDERAGRGERGGRNVDGNRRDENRDSDALLGGMDEVAETFQQGFQDFLTALQERPLREHIGHTPVQVLAGGVLGVVVGTAYALALRGEAGTH